MADLRDELQTTLGSTYTAVTLRASENSLEVAGRERVAALPTGGVFDISPDGNRVLAMKRGRPPQLVVNTNWLPQLRARLAGK